MRNIVAQELERTQVVCLLLKLRHDWKHLVKKKLIAWCICGFLLNLNF